ncbi:hypothetical protein Pd630_LPD10110 (plasmid) [Rhodococcus opacus PD630]|nr:hypothetical protein Pd630_LPD10110 [Rhodococcus opacus PD630]
MMTAAGIADSPGSQQGEETDRGRWPPPRSAEDDLSLIHISVSVDSPSQPFGRGDQHAVGTAAATRTQARAMQSLPGSIIHKYGAVNDS